MASDLLDSSSATTHQPEQLPYDVFLSFRGKDTRDNFVSHLHKELCGHQIKTFIDYDLNRGEDFPPALLTAIQESSISIIVFSENYADSKWCLEELVKIMECKNSSGQIVLPVFYGVDPAHVRSQTGNFGVAFRRLQKRLNGEMDLDKVRSHLMEAANISGWNSQIIRQESKLITEIVGDVLHKLNLISFSYSTNLIGIFHHIEKVESLLCLDKSDICIVGIWGMGGIGKTTIARAVFNHICGRFDECCLLLNVHDELKKQSVNVLRDKLLSNIFERDCQVMGIQSLKPDFIRRQLQQKKVLIVLDDVNDPIYLKELLGGQDYSFGTGSKILMTSRNRQVLKSVTDKMYAVETMNEKDAMTLFSVNAFKQKCPISSYKELSMSVVNYARGNPLALVVLGSALFDSSKKEWLSALEGLEKEPNNDIRNVLMISYGTLSHEEKQIFLDIACFFCGIHRDSINEYYGTSGLFKIKTLQDKSLITISSSNIIEMHNLLMDMGRSIDQEEHFGKPAEKRERLWTHVDICTVLAKKTGTVKIKAILLDMSGMRELQLDGDAFGGMDSLQVLNFYKTENHKNKVYFKGSGGLEYLPQGLRCFRWDGFPAKYLPPNFCAEHLVELRMDSSRVKKLWRGVQNVRNLRVLSLKKCSNLIKIPDLSKAKKLRMINLWHCKSCRNAPRAFVSEALEYLNLSGCLNVRRFPDISSKILKYLNLNRTDIKEVPSSIEFLSRLEKLNMRHCKSLSSISTNILKLESLVSLDFNGCIKLESFPKTLEPLENLQRICLGGCRNLKISQNLYNMTSLKSLHLERSKNLKSLPIDLYSMRSLKSLYLDESGITQLPTMYAGHLNSLRDVCLQAQDIEEMQPPLHSSIIIERLYLKGCHSLRMTIFCDAIPCLSSLKDLNLSGNKWESLPENMDQLSNLIFLEVSNCKCLRSIPKLPSSLKRFRANDCESLEWIRMDEVIRERKLRRLTLANCFKLGEVTQRQILTHSRSMIMQSLERHKFYTCIFPFPGTEILEAKYMGMETGSCATIQFPSSEDWDDFLGFYICLVCTPRNGTLTGFRCVIKENDHVVDTWWHANYVTLKQSEHLFIGSERRRKVWMGREVSFEFNAKIGTLDVIKCGVQLLFKNTPPVLPTTRSFMLHPIFVSTTKTEKKQEQEQEQDQPPPIISAPSSINRSPKRPSRLRSLLKRFCCILILLVFGYIIIGPYFGLKEVSWMRRVGKKERHAVCLVLIILYCHL